MLNPKDVYGSGLSFDDWDALRDVIWPFLHANEPWLVEMSVNVPHHLAGHEIFQHLKSFRETRNPDHLEKAGRLLVPSDSWYLVLTK